MFGTDFFLFCIYLILSCICPRLDCTCLEDESAYLMKQSSDRPTEDWGWSLSKSSFFCLLACSSFLALHNVILRASWTCQAAKLYHERFIFLNSSSRRTKSDAGHNFSRIHTRTFTWAFIHRNHRVHSVSMEIIWISSSIFYLLIISLNDFTSLVLHFFFIIDESKFDEEKLI